MIQFIFRHLIFLFVTCVGIASVRLGGPSIHNHNKGETMSKRPPLGNTGKLALAGNRNRARQLLDREQRERDLRDLLSLVGKNSSLAVSSCSGQGTPSRNERYAACAASAEKACLNVDLLLAGISTDILAHGITDVAEKIVFDGDGGMPKPPTSELDVVDEESDSGTEDDADADDSSGSSGSSGGGARVRSERAARYAAALVTLPVPDVIVEVVPEYFSCCVDTHCRSVDDQTSPRKLSAWFGLSPGHRLLSSTHHQKPEYCCL